MEQAVAAALETATAPLQALLMACAAAAAPFTLRFVWLNDAVAVAAAAAGVRVDVIRVAVHLLLNYPLAYAMKRLPTTALRHAFAAVVGLLSLHFLLGAYWVHPVGLVALSYGLLLALPPGVLTNVVVFAVALAWLSLTHFHRMYYPDIPYDPSAAQMVLVIKITSLSFNLYDASVERQRARQKAGGHGTTIGAPAAARPPTAARAHLEAVEQDLVDAAELAAAPGADLPAAAAGAKAGRADEIAAERRKLALSRLPSPLEYFGFMLLFTTVFTGPAFSYREYIDTVDGSRMRRERALVMANAVASGRTAATPDPLSSTWAAVRVLGVAVIYIAGHLAGATFFPLSAMWSDTPTVLGRSLPANLLTMYICMLAERFKYYFAWSMAEGASVMAEFGFNGRDAAGRPLWNAIDNMDVLAFELSESPRDASIRWNRVTGQWLRRYVFERLAPGPLQLWALYFVSAFWHGFYPGYYAFFLSAALLQEGVKGIRAHVRPLFVGNATAKRAYDLAGIVATSTTVAYFGAAFMALYVERCVVVWSRVYYIGHVVLLPAAIAAVLLPPPSRSKGASGSKAKAA